MVAKVTGGLVYGVRGPVVLKHLGQLTLLIAAAAVPPLLVSAAYGSWDTVLLRGLVSLGVGGAGYALARVRAPGDVQTNESMVVVSLAFVVASLAAAVPLAGYGLSPVDALFEAVSGVTTTGLGVVPSIEDMPPDFALARAWTQWYGGLGFVTLSVFLFASEGPLAHRLDPSRVDPEDPVGGTRARGRLALRFYLAVTLVGWGALLLSGMSAFDAATHALSSVSTGGFSSREDSLATFRLPAQVAVLVLCVVGATPFVLLHRAARGSWLGAVRDPQLVALVGAGVVGTALIFLLGPDSGADWSERLGHAAAFAFSAQTTAGFSTQQVAAAGGGAMLVMIVAMFVGGGMGSTAGGIKLARAWAAGRVLIRTLRRPALPEHAVDAAGAGGRRAGGEPRAAGIMALILLWILVILASWLLFLAAGHEPLPSLFEVVSATGTVGLSSGLTGAGLEPGLRLVLCLDMLLGRLEIVAVLVVFAPRTWLGRRRRSR